jgi:DNA-binding transcriptional MerR regulator
MRGAAGLFNIRELSEAAGVTVRTVHYYVSEGLLPAPRGEGRQAYYTTGHVARLRLIAALRYEGLSLAAIRTRVAPLSDEEASAALDALERRDDDSPAVTAVGLFEAAVSEQLDLAQEAQPGSVSDESAGAYVGRILERNRPQGAPLMPTQRQSRSQPVRPERWFTYRVEDGIELHVREDRNGRSGRRMQGVVAGLRDLLRRYFVAGGDDSHISG